MSIIEKSLILQYFPILIAIISTENNNMKECNAQAVDRLGRLKSKEFQSSKEIK